MTLLAIIQLKVPEVDKTFKKEIIVFKEEKEVELNLGYSLSQFIGNNWKEASGLMVGSGSMAWLIKWLMDQRKKGKLSSQPKGKNRHRPGFVRYLDSQKDSDNL